MSAEKGAERSSFHLGLQVFKGCFLVQGWVSISSEKLSLFYQKLEVLKPLKLEEMEAAAHQCHFLRNPPRLSRWLLQRRLFKDDFRLRACGNVVIPRMAELAVQILAAMYRESMTDEDDEWLWVHPSMIIGVNWSRDSRILAAVNHTKLVEDLKQSWFCHL